MVTAVQMSKEEPRFADLPLQEKLSSELHSKIPPIGMKPYFYTDRPDRSLVRFNNRLLHEGDWLDQDMQVV